MLHCGGLDGWEIFAESFEKKVIDLILIWNIILEDAEKLYCVCQKKYKEGDPMMGKIFLLEKQGKSRCGNNIICFSACERCNEWYHIDCVGYIGTMQLAE